MSNLPIYRFNEQYRPDIGLVSMNLIDSDPQTEPPIITDKGLIAANYILDYMGNRTSRPDFHLEPQGTIAVGAAQLLVSQVEAKKFNEREGREVVRILATYLNRRYLDSTATMSVSPILGNIDAEQFMNESLEMADAFGTRYNVICEMSRTMSDYAQGDGRFVKNANDWQKHASMAGLYISEDVYVIPELTI